MLDFSRISAPVRPRLDSILVELARLAEDRRPPRAPNAALRAAIEQAMREETYREPSRLQMSGRSGWLD